VDPPACVTKKVCPATVKVPVLESPVLALTEKITVPLPEPDDPEVTVTQLALLMAVQTQPLPAVTVTLPFPPAASKLFWRGAME
jgi:hypothetical protein